MSDVLDAAVPYASTREHVLDEIALVRARALTSVGGLAENEAPQTPPPDPALISRRVALSLAAGVELRLPRLESTFGFLPDGKLRQNALITVEDPLYPRDVPLQALRVKIDRRLGLWLLGQAESSAP